MDIDLPSRWCGQSRMSNELGAANILPHQEGGAPLAGGEKAQRVRAMFQDIAPAYDLNNRLLSGGTDVWWRKKTVAIALNGMKRPGLRVVDLCTGTGDLAFALWSALRGIDGVSITGYDFTPKMIDLAREKAAKRGAPVTFDVADALALPMDDASADVVTIAFGLRNLADPDAGLREMGRILTSGGRLVILEFTQPPNSIWRRLSFAYCFGLLPWIGGLVSGRRDAYKYLAHSIEAFDSCEKVAERLKAAGFVDVTYRRLMGGIAAIHSATKA